MRWIDPGSYTHLNGSALANREKRARQGERIHWAMLLGSVPAAVCAIVVREYWFAVYLLIANVLMNVYPIFLQRYTRARLTSMIARTN
jgi:Glycosyl-4,4'-diaponeurosporenoate acyltransferase